MEEDWLGSIEILEQLAEIFRFEATFICSVLLSSIPTVQIYASILAFSSLSASGALRRPTERALGVLWLIRLLTRDIYCQGYMMQDCFAVIGDKMIIESCLDADTVSIQR